MLSAAQAAVNEHVTVPLVIVTDVPLFVQPPLEVMVAVVLQPGASLSPEELLDFCQTRMAHFAVPRYVRYMDSLPKNASQRVEKLKLRADGVTEDTWDREVAGYTVRR